MRRWLVWIGVAISIVFLFLALRGIHFDEFARAVQRANPLWLLPGIAFYFVSVIMRAWRWSYLLRPLKAVSAGRLFPIVVIGYMGNNIYPARIGELLRAYVLRRDEGVPIASSLATVLIERMMDGIVMIGFALIGLQSAPNVSARAGQVINLAIVLFAVASAVFFWMALAPTRANRLAERVITRLIPHRFQAPLLELVHRFVQGARSLRSPRDLLATFLSTVVVWLLETVKYASVAQAFDIALPFGGLMLINGLSNLFTVIPGAPGAVGTFDAGGMLAMRALGVDDSLAAAYVLTLHGVLWLPVTLLGAFFMLREGLRWSDLRRAEEAAT
ncbi:MAG: flippase-like domain-containing protein [Thermoflexales bacterium]|nr:flippase-like domain-containing protein [Thermoflexales bacterium]MDW8350757.1 lysylphosphatidylglycerol synthase transmembrane domain-containing protein [Anaerolineae bacterium]